MCRPLLGTLERSAARAAVRALGWRIEGELPATRRFVLVCAPHTSRRDLWMTLLFGSALGIRVHWLGKRTLFWAPNRYLLEALGGIPINREGGEDTVHQLAALFGKERDLVLAISPEGAKRFKPWWRSGFWHLAKEANVPIVLASLDWRLKICRIGPTFVPTRIEDDIERLRVALADVTPRHPERFGPVRLRPEGESPPPGE